MISEKEFNQDVAMLAGLVGGHLNYIDKITENQSNQANRINLREFIEAAQRGTTPNSNNSHPTNQRIVPEEVVQQIYPDVQLTLTQEGESIHKTASAPSQGPILASSIKDASKPKINISQEEYDVFLQEIKSIKSTIQHIDGTFTKISGMLGKVFNFITEKEKNNQEN